MAGLIKGQILKRLSKFVKNLSPSQISLSALRGEGELTDLELEVELLAELLELPAWVRLTQATCNRANIRIQWTKLKTVPIQLSLDEIRVKVETCEELRTAEGGGAAPLQLPASGAYGFTERIVDGITITVNLVHVQLSSLAFTASVQMSRISVESRSPTWAKCAGAGLPATRIKDPERGEVLTFKELSWQTVRVEARSTVQEDLTPLRLITNQARCRVTLKKRMSDCAILGARIVLILDDLLWVLTDDQLKAALHFLGSVSGLVRTATERTQKAKAARKLDIQQQQGSAEAAAGLRRGSAVGAAGGPAGRAFRKYDVQETSYHFYSDRIDLHFCDDPGGGRSEHPELGGGGAFQVSLARLQVDHYPYHLARGERKHWVRYSTDSPHRAWLQSGLAQFDTRLLDELLSGQHKTPLSRAGGRGGGREAGREGPAAGEDGLRDLVVSQLSRMMVAAVVVRLADLTLWRVSTGGGGGGGGRGRAAPPAELLRGDCARLHLPPDLPLLHLELSTFYYPGQLAFPLPPPCLLLTVNPITAWLDVLTLLWLNAFALNLQRSVARLQGSLQLEEGDSGYANIKVELVMPRVVCAPRGGQAPASLLRPDSLQASASKVSIANYRSRDTGSRADLAAALDRFQQAGLFFGAAFPSRDGDPPVVHQRLVTHATGADIPRPQGGPAFRRDLLWTEARDVWHLAVDSVWAEFLLPGGAPRPVPLMDAAPLQAWLYLRPQEGEEGDRKRPNRRLLAEYYGSKDAEEPEEEEAPVGLHVLALASQLVSLQLDHHQLLFLLRLAESLGELGAFLAADSARIEARPAGMVVGAVLPQLDLSIILPCEGEVGDVASDTEEEEELDITVEPAVEEALPPPVLPEPAGLVPVADHSDPLSAADHQPCPPPLLSNGLPPLPPPPRPPLRPALSTNGLTPELAIALDRMQTSSSLSPGPHPAAPSRRGLWGLWGDGGQPAAAARQGGRSPDLDFDTLSVRSDDSGESSWTDLDGMSVMTEGDASIGEALFRVERDAESGRGAVSPCLEVGEEAGEGAVSPGPGEPAAERRVSVLTLHLGRLAAAQLAGAAASSLLLTAESLGVTEGPPQDYGQFQFRFGQSGKAWSETTLSGRDASCPAIALRLDSRPPARPAAALASLPADLGLSWAERVARATEGRLQAQLAGISLATSASTLARLADWLQDEVVPAPLPVSLAVTDLRLLLTEDRPPPPGLPPPPPLALAVAALAVERDAEGVVRVQGGPAPRPAPAPAPSLVEAELRAQLAAAREEARVLRGLVGREAARAEEGDRRAGAAAAARVQAEGRLEGLVQEKRGLLDTLRYLQEELLRSGKK